MKLRAGPNGPSENDLNLTLKPHLKLAQAVLSSFLLENQDMMVKKLKTRDFQNSFIWVKQSTGHN